MIYNTSKRFLPIYRQSSGPDFDNMPLTYKALADDSYFRLSGANPNWQYKINDGEWIAYTNNNRIDLVNGDTVSFSGDCSSPLTSRVVGSMEVFGNLSSIVGYADELKMDKQLYAMFSGQTGLVHASGLVIPFASTSAAPSGMRQMFATCTNLVTAPVISTSTWGNHGCAAMFSGCTSLTSVTMNWSNTTHNYAMQKVFRGCTALRKVRILGPTTTQAVPFNYNWLDQTSGATIQCVEVDWTSWPNFTDSANPFISGATNSEYSIFIAPASLDNSIKPSNWTRITKDNGVMILSSTNRAEYSSKLNSIVTNLVWNDSTNHYDLVFAE